MQYQLTVTGMTCGHCEMAVRRAVLQHDAQAKVDIDRTQNRVQVDSKLSREQLSDIIREEGYQVEA